MKTLFNSLSRKVMGSMALWDKEKNKLCSILLAVFLVQRSVPQINWLKIALTSPNLTGIAKTAAYVCRHKSKFRIFSLKI